MRTKKNRLVYEFMTLTTLVIKKNNKKSLLNYVPVDYFLTIFVQIHHLNPPPCCCNKDIPHRWN